MRNILKKSLSARVEFKFSHASLSTAALPSYRSLLPSSHDTRKKAQQPGMSVVDEKGVHGGEFSVRPNMQESMVFLRKLFTHQHQEGGKASIPNLMSPSDGDVAIQPRGPRSKLALVRGSSCRFVTLSCAASPFCSCRQEHARA